MDQQGVEVRSISTRRVDEKTWGLVISLEVMADTELDAIGWFISKLEEDK